MSKLKRKFTLRSFALISHFNIHFQLEATLLLASQETNEYYVIYVITKCSTQRSINFTSKALFSKLLYYAIRLRLGKDVYIYQTLSIVTRQACKSAADSSSSASSSSPPPPPSPFLRCLRRPCDGATAFKTRYVQVILDRDGRRSACRPVRIVDGELYDFRCYLCWRLPRPNQPVRSG